jgi:sialate O-acetylesterase
LCGSGSTASSPSFRITGDLALPKLEEGEYELRVFFDGATKTETPAKALRFAHLHLLDTLAEEADAHKTAANVVTAVPRREMTESLVTNGSFEAVVNGRPGGWINSGTAAIVTNPAEAFAGANCLKLSKAANVSTRFSVERTDSYWISFRMRGTPGATFRFPFSWSYKDWVDLTATTEWKEYRLMRTYTAGVTNEVRFKVEDGKSEFFVDDVRVTPILNRLGSPFSSHMVMQRGKPIPVWGRTYFPNQTVSVEFAGRKKEAVSDANGYWRVFFKARDKGGPYTLKVSGIAEELTDIVMGDVWLCAGQSNMHFGLDNVNGLKTNAPEVAARASNDHLRLWFDPGLTAADPTREHAMMIDPKRSFGLWQRCTPETVLLPNTPGSWRGFSAVGYFFGQAIQPIAGVPVGLVEIAVGGTSAETWTSPIGIAGLDNVPLPVVDPKNLKNDTPSAYWNGTVSPVIPMPIKGILWYQGESNSGQPCWYNRVLPNLIRDWRLHFRQGDVPFYFVQICAMDSYQPFDVAWAVLRESQLRVAQSGLTNVAMAVSYDLEDEDNPWDVHPRNKKDVADRLARIALARDYGQKNVVYTGPVYREMKREGNSIRLFFDHAEGGLLGHGEHLNGFTLLDEQRRFHDATATIDGETVVVSAPGVETPAHVRYAFVQYTFPKPNLYNKTGLPASPFRTDGP